MAANPQLPIPNYQSPSKTMEPITNLEKINDLNEKMFAASIIDDPVFSRQLYLDLESSLPINVRMNERGIQGIKEEGISLSDPSNSKFKLVA